MENFNEEVKIEDILTRNEVNIEIIRELSVKRKTKRFNTFTRYYKKIRHLNNFFQMF